MEIFKFCPLCKGYLRRQKVDGRRRLVCQRCGWINYKNPLPVVVCVAKNKKNKVFVAKRNLSPGKNKWALPGGFIEAVETSEAACLRELKEETGLQAKIKRLLGVYFQKTQYYGPLLVVGYEVKVLKNKFLLNDELKEADFFSKKEIPYIPFSSHRKMIEEVYKNDAKIK
ncbi:MAG: NUDIX hydrolase [Candidatus Omnitrophica bacterium]|nr:NUDIX hydrolase [Candidatus Omnitrophota bacterium]